MPTSTAGTNRRARRREQARAAIVSAAMELFATGGIYNTRVEDITERADIAKGAFYTHFVSKEALVADLLERGVALLHDTYLAAVPQQRRPPARITEIVKGHEAFFGDYPVYALLFHQARGLLLLDDNATNPLRLVFKVYLARLADQLGSGTDASRAAELAAVVGGAIVGYRSLRLAAGLPLHRDPLAAVLLDGVPRVLRRD